MMLTGAIIILLVSAVTISALPLKLNEENSSLLAEDGLFEGDLKIPESLIRAHYNLSEMNGTELGSDGSGSAAEHSIDLWVNGIVPYVISCEFSSDTQALIRFAMDRWENITCLQFVPRRSYHSDYIHFQNSDEECYSDSIGRKSGKQIVNLGDIGCETYGIILHEIAHAVGLWHEQSRPDRDDYVRINYENIQSGKESQFRKRNDFEIHNQSLPYDYGSIMHYPETAFVKDSCEDCKTIEASNEMAYEAQGSPRLGQINYLTCFDIGRMNRLYSCLRPDACGTLTVVIKYGRKLKDTDKGSFIKRLFNNNLPDPYVEIIAFDILGNSESKSTKVKSETRNPVWDETLRFTGSHLQFFRIKVWDKDRNADDELSKSETVVAIPGFHESQIHCGIPNCKGYIMYDYTIV